MNAADYTQLNSGHPFTAMRWLAHLAGAARPARRARVLSQHAVQIVSAMRGNGVWLPSVPAATNVYPGSGDNVIINKAHPGTARAWHVRQVIP